MQFSWGTSSVLGDSFSNNILAPLPVDQPSAYHLVPGSQSARAGQVEFHPWPPYPVGVLPPACSEVPTPFANSSAEQEAVSRQCEQQCTSTWDDRTSVLPFRSFEQPVGRFTSRPPGRWQSESSRPVEKVSPWVPQGLQSWDLELKAQIPLDERVEQLGRGPGSLRCLNDSGLEALVPRNEHGELTSLGAIKHSSGHCSPCIFWFKDLCTKSIRCTYCHMVHEGQKAKRIRPSKRTREQHKGSRNEDSGANLRDLSSDEGQSGHARGGSSHVLQG